MHYKFPDTTILYEASSSTLCVLIDFESRDSIAEKKNWNQTEWDRMVLISLFLKCIWKKLEWFNFPKEGKLKHKDVEDFNFLILR